MDSKGLLSFAVAKLDPTTLNRVLERAGFQFLVGANWYGVKDGQFSSENGGIVSSLGTVTDVRIVEDTIKIEAKKADLTKPGPYKPGERETIMRQEPPKANPVPYNSVKDTAGAPLRPADSAPPTGTPPQSGPQSNSPPQSRPADYDSVKDVAGGPLRPAQSDEKKA